MMVPQILLVREPNGCNGTNAILIRVSIRYVFIEIIIE
jgi:hypothetical protein